MNETRLGDTLGQLSRHLVVGEAGFTNLALVAYVFVASLIGGAASAGAGLAILAIGLLLVFTLDFVRWRTDESRNRR